MLEKLFKLKEHNTTVRTEMIAGIITFLTMSYVLVVNPNILGGTGMDKAALFTATAIASILGTLFMAFIPNLPIAQAPGMGLNSFFAFSVVLGLGYSWQMALTAVFIEGIIFIILTLFNVRELIVKTIPLTIKEAIPVGIGLFITLIGMKNAGLVIANKDTIISLGDIANHNVWVALIGLVVTAVLYIRNVYGSFFIGIAVATVCAAIFGLVHMPQDGIFSLPPDISPIFMQFSFEKIFSLDMVIVVFTFLFVNLFDTIGTLLAVANKAGLTDKDGNFLKLKSTVGRCTSHHFRSYCRHKYRNFLCRKCFRSSSRWTYGTYRRFHSSDVCISVIFSTSLSYGTGSSYFTRTDHCGSVYDLFCHKY